MDKRLVKAWVADLRSGKFPQCAGTLHRVEGEGTGRTRMKRAGYCCLGVLSVRIAKHKTVLETGWEWDGKMWRRGSFFGRSYIPVEVRDAIGLSREQARSLMIANDKGRTFPQIANMIERMFLAG